MAQHIESCFWLISWHHVPGMVHQHEPEVVVDFGPPCYCPVDSPDALLGPLPVGNANPVQSVDVVKNPGGVDHEIVLSIVDHDSSVASEESDDVPGIAARDVSCEGVVDIIVAREVIDVVWDSKASFAIVEESDKGIISFSVLSEVEGTHSSPVLVPGVVVVGEEVEKLGGLR